jgi:hypothetical protein
MTKKEFFKIRLGLTLCITVMLGSWLGYQYFQGGIECHHFLAREDMPLVSNAWGMITIPLFTWLLLWRIDKRIFFDGNPITFPKGVFIAFVASLLFGIALGLSIQFGVKSFSGNVPLVLLLLALVFPIYRAEYLLGFVLGLTYFVGGVLPIVVGVVFLLVSALVHLYVRRFLLWMFGLVRSKVG